MNHYSVGHVRGVDFHEFQKKLLDDLIEYLDLLEIIVDSITETPESYERDIQKLLSKMHYNACKSASERLIGLLDNEYRITR